MQAVRSWFDQTRNQHADPDTAWLVVVLSCVAFQALMVARLIFDGSPQDGFAFELVQSNWGALGVTIAVVGAGIALLWCPRRPVLGLAIIGAAYLAASAVQMHDYFSFPLIFALLRVVADCGFASVIAALGATACGMLVSSSLATTSAFVNEFAGQLSVAAISTLTGVAVRSVRGWRSATRQSRQDAERARTIANERDRAVARSRIAAELHDSVGHNLTAIIALSQGLVGNTDDAELDESLQSIESLAREGLAETRHAVSVLGRLEQPAEVAADQLRSHSWDEVHTLADRVRALGVPVTVTETGRRPAAESIADLGFAVIREALTNAVRHNASLDQVGVAIEHAQQVTRVTIRSHGDPRQPDTRDPGSGLRRLRQSVTAQGGTFTAGPGEYGEWVVQAELPAATLQTTSPAHDVVALRSAGLGEEDGDG